MNDCSISSQQHIPVWIGGVTLTKLLVSLLDCILIQYDTKILFAFSNDTGIHIQNR